MDRRLSPDSSDTKGKATQLNINKSTKARNIFHGQANIGSKGDNISVVRNSPGQDGRKVADAVNVPEALLQPGSIVNIDQSVTAQDIYHGQANINTSGLNVSVTTNSYDVADRAVRQKSPTQRTTSSADKEAGLQRSSEDRMLTPSKKGALEASYGSVAARRDVNIHQENHAANMVIAVSIVFIAFLLYDLLTNRTLF